MDKVYNKKQTGVPTAELVVSVFKERNEHLEVSSVEFSEVVSLGHQQIHWQAEQEL